MLMLYCDTSLGVSPCDFINGMLVCNFRYSAVRKQFGPTPDEEIPVIEYQLQVSS